ncbi:MAG: hypothetical protein LUI87_08020 [Lachnospiraceae bacterium]|nr:hypothetical protein [Lachnospiraceae bacterium]
MEVVDYIFNQFKELLTRAGFAFTKEQLVWLCNLLDTVFVQYLDEEKPVVSLRDGMGRTIAEAEVELNSQVIDVVPIWKDGYFLTVCPVLALEKKEHWNGDDKTARHVLIHEICHLLSIGKYVPAPGEFDAMIWKHSYGINDYAYELQDGQLVRRNYDGSYLINEMVNEFVTGHFVKAIFGEELKAYPKQRQFEEYVATRLAEDKKDITDLVHWYFTGSTERLRELLLALSYREYGDLEKSVRNGNFR